MEIAPHNSFIGENYHVCWTGDIEFLPKDKHLLKYQHAYCKFFLINNHTNNIFVQKKEDSHFFYIYQNWGPFSIVQVKHRALVWFHAAFCCVQSLMCQPFFGFHYLSCLCILGLFFLYRTIAQLTFGIFKS